MYGNVAVRRDAWRNIIRQKLKISRLNLSASHFLYEKCKHISLGFIRMYMYTV